MHAGVYGAIFLVTAGLTGLSWRLAGPERAGRFVGLVFFVAFLFAWAIVVAPGWRAFDALGRIGHIVLGATVIGVILDTWRPPRGLAIPIVLAFVLGVSWVEASGGLFLQPDRSSVLAFGALAAAGIVLAWRTDQLARAEVPMGPTAVPTLVLLMIASLSLAAIARVADAPSFAATGCVLAVTIAGFLPWAWATGAILPAAMVGPAAAALLALAWGIVEGKTGMLPAVVLAALTLFADGTARRVPLPKAGISAILYPVMVGGIALLALALAVAVAYAVRAAS